MGKVVNGNIVGNVGNLNYYVKDGVNIVRKKRGPNNVRPSGKQLATCNRFEMASKFISPIMEFIRVSYAWAAKSRNMTAYNLMLSELLKHATREKGEGHELDMSKVLVSKGRLRSAIEPRVEIQEDRLIFTWEVADYSWPAANERVMLMAYVPELGEAAFNLAGAKRSTGTDYLSLNETWRGKAIETYIAYRAETGIMVSDSLYTGKLIF